MERDILGDKNSTTIIDFANDKLIGKCHKIN